MNKSDRLSRGGKILWVIIALLLILLLLSTALLSVRLYDYIRTDSREVFIRSDIDEQIEVFSAVYNDALGEVVVKGTDGENVVAPGTSVDYTIRIRNADKSAIDYDLIPDIEFVSEHKMPVVVRMLNGNDEYIVGDAKTWVPIEEMNALSEHDTLARGESTEYLFQWKWEFESGEDEYDTFLGNEVIDVDIALVVEFTLHAEANTDIEINGGFMESGLGEIVFMSMFVLLLIAVIIILIVWIMKNRKKDEASSEGSSEASENKN